MKPVRLALLFLGTGWIWYLGLNAFFIWSGAQRILGNPQHQSAKFIKCFIGYEPLPRMASNPSIVWKGLMVAGFFASLAFLIINRTMSSGWLKRGLLYGIIHWLIMTPWFEFYLPYNVMHEPLSLVILEGLLWLCVALTIGIYMSFVMNAGVTGKK